MKQEYISYWQNTLQHSQNLEFYFILDLTRETAGRRALVKLRISNHKLIIELGRYNQTTKDNRHCPFCGCTLIEDEVHFLFLCPTHTLWLEIIFTIKSRLWYQILYYQLPVNVLNNELTNSSNYFINSGSFHCLKSGNLSWYRKSRIWEMRAWS